MRVFPNYRLQPALLSLLLAFSCLSHFAAGADPTDELAAPKEIKTPDGFTVDLVYAVTGEKQGSWVVMAVDPQGRIYACDQRGRLYRVTIDAADAESDRPAASAKLVDLDIGQAQGLLWAHDSLYVVVNGSVAEGPGLYRLRDTDGDDALNEIKLLTKLSLRSPASRSRSFADRIKQLVIRSGHGPHAVCLGPKGEIYVVGGNHAEIPATLAATSPLRNWGEDVLLPREPDSQGIANGILAPGGWIARTDADGQQWELLAGGLRNPYDLAINLDGELFVFDSDMEFDAGTPWYRPTRINHILSGGEYGWRFGTAKWPDYYADSVGSVVDVGFGSPTGVTFGTGAKFPARYQQAIFAGDWSLGRILAMHLTPQGASYRGTFEVFATGKPLPVVDLLVHPDGALYILVGGRRTPSAIYRVRYIGQESTTPVNTATTLPKLPVQDASPAAQQLRQQIEHAAAARQSRRKLAALHHEPAATTLDAAWPYLSDPDRYLRYAARVAIERQPVEQWRERALAETSSPAAIQAMLALARYGQPDDLRPILARLARLPWSQLSESTTLDALRVYQLAFVRLGSATDVTRKTALQTLDPLYPSPHARVNRELCQLLVYLEAPLVIERTLALVHAAATQEDQFHGIFTLRLAKDGWTDKTRRDCFSWLAVAEQKYQGGDSFLGFVRRAKYRLDKQLTDEERESLADVLAAPDVAETSETTFPRQFVESWQPEHFFTDLAELDQGRNFERGRAAYAATGCAKCHRLAGQGAATGPDLTGVGARFSSRYLLDALLVPSKVIPDEYRTHVFVCENGQVVSGRVVEQTPQTLHIRTDPFAKQPVAIRRDTIEEQRASPTSEMPAGLLNILTHAEVLDLIAYLRAAGKADDPAFRASK